MHLFDFFSHPDFNRRLWNFTKSILPLSKSRGLLPPVGNFTLPRRKSAQIYFFIDSTKAIGKKF
jgi:hypothetical protein